MENQLSTVSKRVRRPIDVFVWQVWRLKMLKTTQIDIHEKTKLSRPTIADAINTGMATQDTIDKLQVYFDKIAA